MLTTSTSEFPFLKSLEDSWEEILGEYRVLAPKYQVKWFESIHNDLWYIIELKFQGQDLENKKLAPVTSKLCDAISGIHTYGFSIMRPGCEIRPHVGYTNEVLRGHLSLVSNQNSGIKIGGQDFSWTEGKSFVFDDTLIHSAWNRGSEDRVVLLFDFFHFVA
jgi:beta-hydroxylase